LEYILCALNWILEQEDVTFKGRPDEKQRELDGMLAKLGINVPSGKLRSELAISLFCCRLHPQRGHNQAPVEDEDY